ncbi:hypothetical protein CMV30_13820 [Nibricoccus aquaticus]|uniref:Uncharacterized protein n=1 Tax=Nibricoccus aquaticus TaxID=2576891 RepID=A0A290Q8A8_9BACT|nr:hypothetical protein CMV30_13820 [Nibricoccus aquaticus]
MNETAAQCAQTASLTPDYTTPFAIRLQKFSAHPKKNFPRRSFLPSKKIRVPSRLKNPRTVHNGASNTFGVAFSKSRTSRSTTSSGVIVIDAGPTNVATATCRSLRTSCTVTSRLVM